MFLQLVSALLGWSYTCLWSLSFWPQTINNYRRKSVTGFSQDFAHLNLLGFTSYATYNLAFLVSKTIQEQYRDRHAGHSHVVRWNDAAFAVHAAVLGAAQVAQSWFYAPPGSRQSHSARLSRFAIVSLSVLSLLIVAAVVVAWTNDDGHQSEGSADAPKLVEVQWLDVVNLLSYVKLYVTLVKYLPQINLNRRRKSTRGFSIESILLDFSGGLLSLLQLVIDAGLINHDWSAVTGDFGKLGLALLSLTFDVVIMTQHYLLYGDVEPREHSSGDAGERDEAQPPTRPDDTASGERQPLLSDNDRV